MSCHSRDPASECSVIPISLDNNLSIRIRRKGCRGEEHREEPARWALARRMPTLGPCQQDRKAQSTEILLAFPYLRVLVHTRRSSSAPGSRPGRGAPELTVAPTQSRPEELQVLRPHSSSRPPGATAPGTAERSRTVGASATRPPLHFFRNELLDSLRS